MSSAVAGYRGAFGADGPPPAYADIALSDCFLLLGTNTAACHPIVWSRIRDRQAEGAFVICADPRATATARESDLHLPVKPGTDLALLNALLHVIDRDGMTDRGYVERSTSGYEEAVAVARQWPPQRAAQTCGVVAADIETAARRFAGAGGAMALWSMGANQSAVGTLKNRGLINLCLATGQIGRPGAGPLSLTGQPNAMGGRETGGLAGLLPGYRFTDRDEDRAAMESHWGLPAGAIPATPGLPAVQLFDALRAGKVRAVWIVATNPAVSLPDGNAAREALDAAELVVVQDAHHPTETSALADAVLPAAAWPEKEGSMTSSERRVSLVQRALAPPGEALPDWSIFARLAAELGHGEAFAWRSAAEVYAEFAATTAGRPCDVSGISHARLRRAGSVQWPAPAGPEERETKRLYEIARFPTADGRAHFAPTPHSPAAEPTDAGFPLTLTTGRVADQWHTMSRTGKSPALRAAAGEPTVELHPADAAAAQSADGDHVRLVSRRGEVIARAVLDDSVPRGCAFAAFHWGALHAPPAWGAVNRVTVPATDPTSFQPELKACAIRIEPARRNGAAANTRAGAARTRVAARRLVVVGTGMAALATVEELRRRRPQTADWQVTMLGAEPGPAYDRIGLSRLLAGRCDAASLELKPAPWYTKHEVTVHAGRPAVTLDLDERHVLDEIGQAHGYDALVLATGSRPFIPPIPGVDAAHVHGFRTRADADAITAAARRGAPAVVVGGGLLGLEAAAGLVARGMRVTVVEAADRLMPQQLDGGGAAMLAKALKAVGIAAIAATTVESIEDGTVTLADGTRLAAELVVVAAGIRPDIELARGAGIDTDRGILVDDALRTSAPGVLAVGECAEHRGTVYGLWGPLAEQARAAGATVCGDPAGFQGAVPATTLKVAGVDLFAGGGQAASEHQDEIVFSDGRRGVYRRLVLDGERLAGAVLVGDVSQARELSGLLRSEDPVPERLLAGPGEATEAEPDPGPEATVCTCNAVTRGEIEQAISARGLTSVAGVARATRASTGCGSCSSEVEALLRRADEPERVHRAETHA
jgi:ferredoxin-nitrate reductase